MGCGNRSEVREGTRIATKHTSAPSAWQTISFSTAAAGLACLFAGIWTSDGAALTLLNPPGDDLAMRISSLIVYGGLFLLVYGAMRRAPGDPSAPSAPTAPGATPRGAYRLFKLATVLCALAYVAGSVIMLAGGPFGTKEHASMAVVALFLLKGIGAPLSVALVCLCARLPYRLIAQVSTLGVLGAFVLKELLGYVAEFAHLSAVATFAVGSALIALAVCLTAPALLHFEKAPDDAPEPAGERERATPLQPLGALFNRNLAAGVVVASIMLGFLRANAPDGPVDLTFAVVVALLLIALVTWLVPNVGVHELFRGALMCTAAGFLLGPVLHLVMTGGGDLLTGVGTALFEVVVWLVAVMLVRSCTEPLLAAVTVRLVIVVGHLAGAALGMGAETWARIEPSAPEAFSLVIVFAYVIMLAYLFNDPVAKLPFTSNRLPAAAGAAMPGETGASSELAPAVSPAAIEAQLWHDLCETVARKHGLTPRETDMLEQLARGRDLAFMEEKFVLSRNTVKMHIKHVYEKLGVHSKQEVIDLVEASRPPTEPSPARPQP